MSQEIVYYNIQASCIKANQTDPDVPAYFAESREFNIVDKPENYLFSIDRFTLTSNNLPVFIPKISSGNTCTYGMIMIYHSGFSVSDPTNLIYVCRNKYVNTPTDPRYFYIYNIQDFVDMVNVAFVSCTNSLNSKAGINVNPPVMVLNSNNTFTIYFDANFFNQADNVSLKFNDDLHNLFRNFSYLYVPFVGYNYQFQTGNKLTNNVTFGGNNYYSETQSQVSMQSWSPITSIVFVSNLGVNYELVSNPYILSGASSSYSQSNSRQNIVTDIVMVADSPDVYNSYIVLSPTFERYEVMNVAELKYMDLAIYWKDKNYNINPVYLSDGDIFTAKIKFKKYK